MQTRWRDIDWVKAQLTVRKLQIQIYNSSKEGDVRTVRRLQNKLVREDFAKLLAVRQVTNDNMGQKMAGIDGIKDVPVKLRITLAESLKIPTLQKPIKFVLILNPGSKDKLPFRISTIFDKCLQVLVKLVLEPEWEAKFERNSYGFRSGRSCHDATKVLYKALKYNEKYAIVANIEKCFEKINYETLLIKTGLHGKLYKQIKYWLESGIMVSLDSNNRAFQNKSMSQSGVISSLLANIALHGLETRVKKYVSTKEIKCSTGRKVQQSRREKTVTIVRHLCDFIVLHNDFRIINGCVGVIKEFIRESGLQLYENNTFIVHSKHILNENKKSVIKLSSRPGFNFLGFHFRHYQSKYSSVNKINGELLGSKLLVLPSKLSIKTHNKRVHEEILNKGKTKSQKELIDSLNPIIYKWVNYFGIFDAKTFGLLTKLDYLLYLKLRKWSKVGKKTSKKQVLKLWSQVDSRKQVFCSSSNKLIQYYSCLQSESSIKYYSKVKKTKSTFDGDIGYWTEQLCASLTTSGQNRKLYKR